MLLEVKKLCKRYDSSLVVDHVSFSLTRGEIIGLLGANGAGKTTTLHMLLGLTTASSGSITYFGKDFFLHRSDILNAVGFASAYIKVSSNMSLWDNLDIYAQLFGISRHDRKRLIAENLSFFGLLKYAHKRLQLLSSGQSICAMLIKAFIGCPKIILLDEPTVALDPDVALRVHTFIKDKQRKHGVSFIITSHNMDEVTEMCNRLLVLQKGRIIAQGRPQTLAESITVARVRLLIDTGLEALVQYVKKNKMSYTVCEKSVEVAVHEQKIAAFLQNLGAIKVRYRQIAIDKPTLEDYFLHIAQGKNKGLQ